MLLSAVSEILSLLLRIKYVKLLIFVGKKKYCAHVHVMYVVIIIIIILIRLLLRTK